ncbi:MAG: hypothetical protein QNJ08_11935 [Crocosphaera sp.]|nr:hypothetical protein [Crocosphaera sp.]
MIDLLFFLQTPPPPPTPLSSMGYWVCGILNRVVAFLPSSPVTLADLSEQLAESIPFIGSYLIYKSFTNLSTVLSLVVFYKIFVVLPGKFS